MKDNEKIKALLENVRRIADQTNPRISAKEFVLKMVQIGNISDQALALLECPACGGSMIILNPKYKPGYAGKDSHIRCTECKPCTQSQEPAEKLFPVLGPCPRKCSECKDSDHHWIVDCTAFGKPRMICKHCMATKPCPDCTDKPESQELKDLVTTPFEEIEKNMPESQELAESEFMKECQEHLVKYPNNTESQAKLSRACDCLGVALNRIKQLDIKNDNQYKMIQDFKAKLKTAEEENGRLNEAISTCVGIIRASAQVNTKNLADMLGKVIKKS